MYLGSGPDFSSPTQLALSAGANVDHSLTNCSPHRLFALDALSQAQVRPAPFPRGRGLLGDTEADRLDIEDGDILRMSQQNGG